MSVIGKFINKTARLAAVLTVASFVAYPLQSLGALSDEIKFPEGTLYGKLSNGLQYLILHNDFPESRVEYRLVWQVGSVQQDDNQGGCAHFLEHMAFGGLKHFPNRGAVKYLESLGMKYGIDINAFTGHDRTIYLFATPSDFPDSLGYVKALSIVADWMDGLTINPDRVKTEKGIIEEELRGYSIEDPFYNLKIGQNRFSRRMPLGSLDEIKSVTADVLEDFYHKWYIPAYAGIVVIGDVDPAEIEKEILKQFSGISPGKDPGLEHYSLDYSPSRQIMIDVDSLAGREQLDIIIPHPGTVNRTLADLRHSLKGRIITDAINRRFSAAKVPAEATDNWYLGSSNHLTFTVKEGSKTSLEDNVTKASSIISDLLKNGFQDDEVAYLSEKVARQTEKNSGGEFSSATICDDFADFIISGEHYISDPAQVAELSEAVRSITKEEVAEVLKAWMSHSDTILYALRTPVEYEEGIILEKINDSWNKGKTQTPESYTFERPQETENVEVPTPAILAERHPYPENAIKNHKKYDALGIEDVEMNNGIRLLLKPTTDDSDVLFAMLKAGGYGVIPKDKLPLYSSVASYIDMGGIAKVPENLGEYLYANNLALSLALENNWHGFLGSFAPEKSNEFFNLVYEKITDPQLLYDDFEEMRSSMYEDEEETVLYKMLRRDPERQLVASMNRWMGNTLDFDEPINSASDRKKARKRYADELNLDSIATFYKSLYSQPEGTTFIVTGNFNPDSVLNNFVSVFNRLDAAGKAPEGFTTLNLPSEVVEERFDTENKTQSDFDYVYFGKYEPGLRNSLVLKLMSFVLRNKVIAELREKRALVYSPYVVLNYEGIPRGYYYFDISSSTENNNMEPVKEAIDFVLDDLRNNDVDSDELEALKRSCIINRRETLNKQASPAWRNTLMSLIKNDEKIEDFNNYEAIIETITPEDIREGFNKYINPELYLLLYISAQDIHH
ncbi:MAG: insulinase family protein [Muribaculaceae bacterium]|nr:insulinase family protein [Muribaculaceae bacterium]